ncbi:MAG: hypothetical protein K2R98_21900 [Gemmataceae bacterium]|nr:hypothetical protein [Gemmataceae bacterium]
MVHAGSLRAGLFGAVVGIVVGLLIIFISVVNALIGPRALPRDRAAEARAQASVAMADTGSRVPDSEQNLRRIAMVQARTGDIDGALTTINASKNPVPGSKDAVKFDVVDDYLYQKVGNSLKPDKTVYTRARKIADSIENPLVKADALRRIASAQEPHDPEAAKKTLQEAVKLTFDTPWTASDAPQIFNIWMLLWPAGLAIFGFLLVLFALPFVEAFAEALAPGDIDVEPAAKS